MSPPTFPRVPTTDLFQDAPALLNFLSSYSCLLSGVAAIMIADFYLLRRGRVDMREYYNFPGGIYWYFYGINWRAIVPWIISVAPNLPGLVVWSLLPVVDVQADSLPPCAALRQCPDPQCRTLHLRFQLDIWKASPEPYLLYWIPTKQCAVSSRLLCTCSSTTCSLPRPRLSTIHCTRMTVSASFLTPGERTDRKQ